MPIRPYNLQCKQRLKSANFSANWTKIIAQEQMGKCRRKDKPRESGRTDPRKAKERNLHRRYQRPESVCALKHAAIHPFPPLRVCRARVYPSDYVFFAVTSVTRGQEREWKRPKKIDEFRAHNEQNKGCDSIYPSKHARQQTHRTEFQQLIPICDRCDSKKCKTLVLVRVCACTRGG